jgi:hypothetical protein
VRGVQYVFRRGAVYWWRRRLLSKVGERERAPIALSLGTRELSKARAIAAHLAVASDGILRQEGQKMLSAAQARSMLEAVARAHLAKMDRFDATKPDSLAPHLVGHDVVMSASRFVTSGADVLICW